MREAADRVAARLEELIKPQMVPALAESKAAPEPQGSFKQGFTHFGFEALQVEG